MNNAVAHLSGNGEHTGRTGRDRPDYPADTSVAKLDAQPERNRNHRTDRDYDPNPRLQRPRRRGRQPQLQLRRHFDPDQHGYRRRNGNPDGISDSDRDDNSQLPTQTAIATPTATSTPSAAGITFVGTGALTDSGSAMNAITLGLPSGFHSGDILVAQIIVYDGTAAGCADDPSGWTSIRHDSASNGNQLTSWLYYRVAGASEPASYTWNISSNWAAGVMGAWRGAATSPLDGTSGANAAGTRLSFGCSSLAYTQ